LSVTANAEAIYQFTPQISLALSGTATIARVRFGSALSSPACSIVANGREKWEEPADAVDVWEEVVIESLPSIWQDAPQAPATNWTEAA
jgi:hypothetical protein